MAAVWPKRRPVGAVRKLISWFQHVAGEGTPEEALAAFYAYESQVPRLAQEKDRGLRELYGADAKTRGYFTLHATADVYHAQMWRNQLEKRVKANPETAEKALTAAETAAKALWAVLDGFEARRMKHARLKSEIVETGLVPVSSRGRESLFPPRSPGCFYTPFGQSWPGPSPSAYVVKRMKPSN